MRSICERSLSETSVPPVSALVIRACSATPARDPPGHLYRWRRREPPPPLRSSTRRSGDRRVLGHPVHQVEYDLRGEPHQGQRGVRSGADDLDDRVSGQPLGGVRRFDGQRNGITRSRSATDQTLSTGCLAPRCGPARRVTGANSSTTAHKASNTLSSTATTEGRGRRVTAPSTESGTVVHATRR